MAFFFLYEAGHLESERRLLEREKEEMRKERERLEKSRGDIRIPQGAFWDPLLPTPDCRAYGKREYHGALKNIPEDRIDMDACMNMPVEIKGVTLKRPHRCGYVDGSSDIHGFWMVDWDQPDCKPWHQDVADKVSSAGKPRIIQRHSLHPIPRAACIRDLVPVVSRLG